MRPYYEHAGITIYHGDCREILPTLDGFGVVVTDPPYGVGMADWDVIDWRWSEMIADRLTARGHVFAFWSVSKLREFRDIPGLRYERVLVWSKPMTFSAQRGGATWHWEPVFWFRKPEARLSACVSDVFTENPPLTRLHPESVNHPTQKPTGIMKRLLNLTEGDALDPFMGSGTTLVAAKALGRRAVGIEIEERYCEIAARRLAQDMLPFAGVA